MGRARPQGAEGADRAQLHPDRRQPPGDDPRPAQLDRSGGARWDCSSYRFGDIHFRRIGGLATFATQLEQKSTLDGEDWSGKLWLNDLWRKRRIGCWRLAHRAIARVEDYAKIPGAVKALQLWR